MIPVEKNNRTRFRSYQRTSKGHDVANRLRQGLVLLLDCADCWAEHVNVQLHSKAL